ncbi:hypothetical protein [Chroococcidiopsis sp. SAG 2025]|nr:hypothetical protein [Chroococcidiopsis sp. SAG 2025]
MAKTRSSETPVRAGFEPRFMALGMNFWLNPLLRNSRRRVLNLDLWLWA